MDTPQLNGSERTYWNGSEIRGEHILASNPHECVEERYKVAYNLGSGKKYWDGWVNVDLYAQKADLRCDISRLEVESNTADAVAAIHVLEHFYVWQGPDLLNEWKRILKPGGKMIIEVPCMDKVFGYAARCVAEKQSLMPFMTIHALWGDPKHKEPAMCHKWGYFKENLQTLMEHVGMREITFKEPNYHFACRDMRCEAIK